MLSVQPVILADGRVRLEPLGLQHLDGLLAAAADGELWNIRVTSSPGPSAADPATNAGTDMSCTRRNFSGWPCDEEAERLRARFIDADPAAKPALLEKLHRRLAERAPYRVLGQFSSPVAYRTSLHGVLPSPVPVYWNIDKD